MNKLEEEKFVAHICDYLDRSIEDMEPALMARLDSARTDALNKAIADKLASNDDEELLVDSILTRLEDQPELSPDIEQRLDAMRQQAVARLQTQPEKESLLAYSLDWIREQFNNSFSLPVGMIATACLTVTVVTLFYTSSNPGSEFSVDDELLLIASADELELYENLDFYLWLEETGFEN